MANDQVDPDDCAKCGSQDGTWTMSDAAEHYLAEHRAFLALLQAAVVLAQASEFGLGPWDTKYHG